MASQTTLTHDDGIDIEDIAKRARMVKASTAYVETVDGRGVSIVVPQSNRYDGFKREITALGELQRVVFYDADSRRLDELALVSAMAETKALAGETVSLLTLREGFNVLTAALANDRKNFVQALAPAWSHASALAVSAHDGWRQAAESRASECALLRAEIKELRSEMREIQKQASEAEAGLAILAAEGQGDVDPVKAEGIKAIGTLLDLLATKIGDAGGTP